MPIKNLTKKIILFLFFNFICSCGLAKASEAYKESITKTITKLMQQYQIPGAAVAIIDHDQLSTYVFGAANKSTNISITNKTIFEVGSITKLFTALLFIQTTDNQSCVKDQLIKYYPELNKNQYLQKITFENLFTYTSGIPFQLPENIETIGQLQDYLLKWQPSNTIGTQWQYSNAGIGLVGIALQNKNHQTLSQLYKKYILQELDMPFTSIEVDKKLQPYFAQGYTENDDVAPHSPLSIFPAAGDLKASIQDLSHFLTVAAGLPTAPVKLRKAMQLTQTPRLEVGSAQQGLVWQIHSLQDKDILNEPEKMNLGPLPVRWLPKEQQVFDGNKLIDKTGATSGFRAYIAVIPAKKVGIVLLLNKYISNGAIVNAGRKILLGISKAVKSD